MNTQMENNSLIPDSSQTADAAPSADAEFNVRDLLAKEWAATPSSSSGIVGESPVNINDSPRISADVNTNEIDQPITTIVKDVDISKDDDSTIKENVTKCQVKNLYASTASACSCCRSWDDKMPFRETTDQTTKTKLEREQFAIVRKQEPHGGQGGWKTHSIEVNSLLIRKSLADVFDDYPGLDTHAVDMTFTRPFTAFIHRWEKLLATQENEESPDTKAHLRLLEELLRPEIEEPFAILQHIQKTGYVAFKDLGVAFVPGEVVVCDLPGTTTAGILREANVGEKSCDFLVRVVDWNGKRFGALDQVWQVARFSGSRQLKGLTVSPLRVHANRQDIEKRLIERGKVFEALKGQHHRLFSGRAWCKAHYYDRLFYGKQNDSRPISERVIVDAESYYILQDECIPDLMPLSTVRRILVSAGEEEEGEGEEISPETQLLTDEQCLLAVARVKGFAVQSKIWCELEISSLDIILWRDRAMQNLVLGVKEKRLLLGLLSPRQALVEFDDFIPGKGRGIIILLCGPPGVGKTLTAESVAEQLQRPLYKLEAGDLGTDVSKVESVLQETLRRCAHWNAVLLIDEADVFLEKRSANSLQRNELVSKYYKGVMILTTNRIASIDAAFESRIDITLQYPDLTHHDRSLIWRSFLGNAKSSIDEHGIEILSSYRLNGRQIKSAVKTAYILAANEEKKLDLEDLKLVLDLRKSAGKILCGNENSD